MSYSISTLLTRNLHDVFGENDPARRRAAIDENFAEDCVFHEPKGVYRGRNEIDRVADGLDLGDVGRRQLDAELLLDDLRELGEVERVDVQRGQFRLAVDVVGVCAEADERVGDDLLDLLA